MLTSHTEIKGTRAAAPAYPQFAERPGRAMWHGCANRPGSFSVNPAGRSLRRQGCERRAAQVVDLPQLNT